MLKDLAIAISFLAVVIVLGLTALWVGLGKLQQLSDGVNNFK